MRGRDWRWKEENEIDDFGRQIHSTVVLLVKMKESKEMNKHILVILLATGMERRSKNSTRITSTATRWMSRTTIPWNKYYCLQGRSELRVRIWHDQLKLRSVVAAKHFRSDDDLSDQVVTWSVDASTSNIESWKTTASQEVRPHLRSIPEGASQASTRSVK